MTAPLVVPFNFQPVSVSVKTASYTIPAGQYAYVVAYLQDGGSFTIDGSTVLVSKSGGLSARSGTLTGGQSFTVAANNRWEGQILYTSGTNVSIGGVSITSPSGTMVTGIVLGPSAVITHTGTNQTVYSGVEIPEENFTEISEGFWVPTGTVINGAGDWRATVSLYNQIT